MSGRVGRPMTQVFPELQWLGPGWGGPACGAGWDGLWGKSEWSGQVGDGVRHCTAWLGRTTMPWPSSHALVEPPTPSHPVPTPHTPRQLPAGGGQGQHGRRDRASHLGRPGRPAHRLWRRHPRGGKGDQRAVRRWPLVVGPQGGCPVEQATGRLAAVQRSPADAARDVTAPT